MWTRSLKLRSRSSIICSAANNRAGRPTRHGLGVVALTVAVLFGGADSATAQKIAYVASDAIFERLPQAIEARATLAEAQAKWRREMAALEETVVKLQSEIQQNRLLWSPQERNQKEGELSDARAKLADYRAEKFGPNGEFEKLYHQQMTPVIELISVAISAEAEAGEFDFVLDKSSRGLPILFANPDYDLTYAVLKRLGVEIDPSELQTRAEEDGPTQLLPDGLPLNVGAESNTSIRIDPGAAVPAEISPVETRESPTIEANPNELLDPTPVEESEDPR